MANCKNIVKRALRRLGVIASNEEVTASDLDIGMEALKEIIISLGGNSSYSAFRDIFATSDYEAIPFDRVIIDSSTSVVISLPDNYQETPIRFGSRIQIRELNTGSIANYFYSSDTASWVLLDDLTENSTFPLGESLEGSFVAILAARLSDEFGVSPSQALLQSQDSAYRKFGAIFMPDMDAKIDYALTNRYNWNIATDATD